jgi:hypothetical protein
MLDLKDVSIAIYSTSSSEKILKKHLLKVLIFTLKAQ